MDSAQPSLSLFHLFLFLFLFLSLLFLFLFLFSLQGSVQLKTAAFLSAIGAIASSSSQMPQGLGRKRSHDGSGAPSSSKKPRAHRVTGGAAGRPPNESRAQKVAASTLERRERRDAECGQQKSPAERICRVFRHIAAACSPFRSGSSASSPPPAPSAGVSPSAPAPSRAPPTPAKLKTVLAQRAVDLGEAWKAREEEVGRPAFEDVLSDLEKTRRLLQASGAGGPLVRMITLRWLRDEGLCAGAFHDLGDGAEESANRAFGREPRGPPPPPEQVAGLLAWLLRAEQLVCLVQCPELRGELEEGAAEGLLCEGRKGWWRRKDMPRLADSRSEAEQSRRQEAYRQNLSEWLRRRGLPQPGDLRSGSPQDRRKFRKSYRELLADRPAGSRPEVLTRLVAVFEGMVLLWLEEHAWGGRKRYGALLPESQTHLAAGSALRTQQRCQFTWRFDHGSLATAETRDAHGAAGPADKLLNAWLGATLLSDGQAHGAIGWVCTDQVGTLGERLGPMKVRFFAPLALHGAGI